MVGKLLRFFSKIWAAGFVSLLLFTIAVGCTCQKQESEQGGLNKTSSTTATPPGSGKNPHEPRFPNEASIFFTEKSNGRICWYMKEKADKDEYQRLTAHAMERASYGASFAQDDWIKQHFPELDKNFVESLKRVLRAPFTSESHGITLVNVGPAGLDWMLKAVTSFPLDPSAPTCPNKP